MPIEVKNEFFDDLQAVISSTLPDDLLLVMGDFNAGVGCGDDMNPSLLGVKGMFGISHLNKNGERHLHFCALHELSIMNTMLAKKSIYQYSYMATPQNKDMALY